MIGYKVVCKHASGQLISFNYPYSSRYSREGQSIIYRINEFTYPKIKASKLFLFKTQIHAERFIGEFKFLHSPVRIFRCEALDARPKKYMLSHCRLDLLERFWENNYRFSRERVPIGTYTASAIKLLERVDKNA